MASLKYADLSYTNLDFSSFPLWCGSLDIQVDVRLAKQLAYHLCSLKCDDEEFKAIRNDLVNFANGFHRIGIDIKKLEKI